MNIKKTLFTCFCVSGVVFELMAASPVLYVGTHVGLGTGITNASGSAAAWITANNIFTGATNHFTGDMGVEGTVGLGTVTATSITGALVSGNGANITNIPIASIITPGTIQTNPTVVIAGANVTVTTNSPTSYTVASTASGGGGAPWLTAIAWGRSPYGLMNSGSSDSGAVGGAVAASASNPSYQPYNTTGAVNDHAWEGENYIFFPSTTGKNTTIVQRFALTNATNVRSWIGISSSADGQLQFTETFQKTAGFRLSTTNAVNPTHWYLCTDGAGSGSATVTDTGIVADTSFHTFKMVITPGTSIVGSIDGVPVATNTTLITFTGGVSAFMGVATLETAVKGFRFQQTYVQQDF